MVNKIQPVGEIVQEMADEAFALLSSAKKYTASSKLWATPSLSRLLLLAHISYKAESQLIFPLLLNLGWQIPS